MDAIAALLKQAVQCGNANVVRSLQWLPASHSLDPEAVAGVLQQVLLQGAGDMSFALLELAAAQHIPAQRMQQLLHLVPALYPLEPEACLRSSILYPKLLKLPGAAAMVSHPPHSRNARSSFDLQTPLSICAESDDLVFERSLMSCMQVSC